MLELNVDGMTCASCATHVKEALEKLPGVSHASVSYPESKAQIRATAGASRDQMLAAIAAPPLPMMAMCRPLPLLSVAAVLPAPR